jgi:hypothetical protein
MAGRLIRKRTDVYFAALADLQASQLENDKLCFATDTRQWFRTTLKGLGSDVMSEQFVSDGSIDTVHIADGALSADTEGRNKMADNYFNEDELVHKFDDSTQLLRGPGGRATNYFEFTGNVVNGEVAAIGDDVYEVEVVNTDSNDVTANDDFANTTNPLTVVDAVTEYSNITFAVGDLIRIENEMLRVTGISGDDVTFSRGASATTAASHADDEVMYVGNGAGTPGNILVGVVTTLTPTAFIPKWVADVNSQTSEPIAAVADGTDGVLFTANDIGEYDESASTDFSNGAWSNSDFSDGRTARIRKLSIRQHTVTQAEENVGRVFMAYDFPPVLVEFSIRQPGAPGLTKAFDGSVLADGNLLVIDNNGGSENLSMDDSLLIVVTDAD